MRMNYLGIGDEPHFLEFGEDLPNALLEGLFVGFHDELTFLMVGFLVRMADPGEIFDLSGDRPLVHHFYVPLDTDLEGAFDEHLDHVNDFIPHILPDLPVRTDERCKHTYVIARKQFGNKGRPPDILVSVLLGETQICCKRFPQDVPIQPFDPETSLTQDRGKGVGDGGFPCSGQPGEPADEPLRGRGCGHVGVSF